MIRVIESVPYVYGEKSRDFQALARTLDAVYNYSRMAIDCMTNYALTENGDDSLLELLARTLGFEPKHHYSSATLRSICSAFKTIMFHKGTKSAIEETVRALLRAQNIEADYYVDITNKDNNDNEVREVQIYLAYPGESVDLTMIDDVLEYILPVGYTYVINKTGITTYNALQQIGMKDSANWNAFDDVDLGAISYNQNKNNLSNINNMDPNKLTPAIGQDTIVSIAQDKSEKE